MKGRLRKADRAFPEKLRQFTPDIQEIYYDGNPELLDTTCVAVVGCRQCTSYGKTVAGTIGGRMAENGVTVVSGLARGIDTAGHLGVLDGGGKTIAVLAGGTDHVYPAENRKLQQRIRQDGLLLSEHPPEYVARPYDFPLRNRIISALSESLVVVEATNRSGALITAECAEEMGKNVYAVPGNITSHYSFGTNKLICENAKPLVFIDDLLTDLHISPQMKDQVCEAMGEDERRVFEIIKNSGEITIDEIYHKTNIKLHAINGIITVLEMKGIIFSSMGKIFVAKF